MRLILLVLSLLTLSARVEAQLPHNIPDFGSGVPSAGTTVSGTVDVLAVRGQTTVPAGATLAFNHALVYEGGSLTIECGTAQKPTTLIVRDGPLAANDQRQFSRGLIVLGRWRVNCPEKTPFVRLDREPLAGHNTLTLLSVPTGWAVGDEVFVPDTRQTPESQWFNSGYALRHERRTITAISGNVITLNAPLTWDHRGARDANGSPTVLQDGTKLLPHVANMTRSVVIRSENPNGRRGHILATANADVDVRGLLIRDMGRTTTAEVADVNNAPNQIGRYPIHFHFMHGPIRASGYRFVFSGSAIVDSLKWPAAIHDSDDGLFEHNVVIGGQRFTGAGIALENGNEERNVIRGNFVADIRGNVNPRSSGSDHTTPGSAGECIWAGGFHNRFIANVVTGCRNHVQEIVSGVGFKLFTPPPPGTAQRQHILEFRDNEAYGLMADGLTIWHLGTDGYGATHQAQQESLIKDLRVWHAYEAAVWLYPVNRVTIDGLVYRFDPSATPYNPSAITSGDYRNINLTVRGGDMHAGAVVSDVTDPLGTWRFENVRAVTRGAAFRFETPHTPGMQSGRNGLSVDIHVVDPQITGWPGTARQILSLRHTTAESPYFTSQPFRVYLQTNGQAYRVFFSEQANRSDLYGGRATCSSGSLAGVTGLVCPDGQAPPPPPPPVDCVVSAWSAWSNWTPINATTEQRTRTRTIVTPPANGGASCPALTETETRPMVVEPPPPVDAVVSAWGPWTGGTWSDCVNGSQSRTETRTRTVITPASNGGSTPTLSETRTATQACTVEPPPPPPPVDAVTPEQLKASIDGLRAELLAALSKLEASMATDAELSSATTQLRNDVIAMLRKLAVRLEGQP